MSLPAASLDAAGTPNRMPEGGGVVYPAWTGEYWSNPDLRGEPDYTRSDIRVRFDWEDWRPTLGVRAESVRDFPTDHFSARWTGKIVARFDETYTFKLVSDERARVKIRPEGADRWQMLIDAWQPHERRTDEAKIALKPGGKYDMVIEYAEGTGDAVCELYWSSPSTPEEVVDYVAANSVHFTMPETLANLNAFSGIPRDGQKPANSAESEGVKVDANGWPTGDCAYMLVQGYSFYTGRGQIVFTGQADVELGDAHFEVDGKRYDKLPKGVGYDPKTNQTRAEVVWHDTPDGTTKSRISLSNTQREPDGPSNTGVTDLYVMCSRHQGGSAPHEPGEIINQEAREAFLPIFSFRVQRTGLNEIEKWDERTLPTYSKIIGQIWRADMAYEKLILAANETGRDIHLNFSDSCDEQFMHKLALLFRYGSDGKEPYTKPTKDPVWPPLNPNLRLYLEHGNEMGWSGIQPRRWSRRYDQEIYRKADNPIWRVLNFDGAVENDRHFGLMRYHAYRTVRMSENMRAVWGDDAMGDRVRVLLFGQYERWFQNGMCQFIDDYYNNPAYVENPRPVSQILWGAGPAVYYGTTNNYMVGDKHFLANGNFEDFKLEPGAAALRPASPDWSFEGNAGVVNNLAQRHDAFTNAQPEGEYKVADGAAVGYRITVGDRDVYAFQVGRHVLEGEKGRAYGNICTLDGSALEATKHDDFDLGKAKAGQVLYAPLEYCGWATSDSSRVGVWKLEAGKSYLIMTSVGAGSIPGPETKLTASPGITIDGAVIATGGSVDRRGVRGQIKTLSGSGRGFPLPTFRYGFATQLTPDIALAPSDPLVDPTWPDGGKGKSFVPPYHRAGHHLAFIAGRGKITQSFNIDHASEYALVFTGNSSVNGSGRDGELPFTVRIDGEVVWNRLRMGVGRKPRGGLFQWGTEYVHLEPGRHTLTIEADSGDTRDIAYFYAVHLGDILDFAGGPTADNFLGAGAATGQTEGRFALVSQLTTAEAQLWGLVPYAYEGGTNAGGDWGGGNLLYAEQFKWNHPISKVADNQWARFWHSYGGSNAFYYYPGFDYKYIHRAETFMPWAAAIDRAHGWELDPTGPPAAPITFTPAEKHYQSRPASTWTGWEHPFESDNAYEAGTPTLAQTRLWKGFIFRAPATGDYTILAETAGDGKAQLIVNDSQAVVEGPAGGKLTATVHLVRGVHSVKIRNLEGKFDLKDIKVSAAD